MKTNKAKEILRDAEIANDKAREFASYFGDAISGPLVELSAQHFNEVMRLWEDQGITAMLSHYIKNAIAQSKTI